MKKIRIQTRPDVSEGIITLFDTAEALYVYMKDKDILPEQHVMMPAQAVLVALKQNEYIEAEWMGCEFVEEKERKKYICLNFIRLAKATPTSNSAGVRVGVHYGWIASESLTFKTYQTDEFDVLRLFAGDEHKLNLAEIFQDEVAANTETKQATG